MTFTRQDLLTFGLGAAVGAAVILGEALVKLEGQVAVDWAKWGYTLGIAELVALGRYLATRTPEVLGWR